MEADDDSPDATKPNMSKEEERKVYNLSVLKHVQAIFGHLACSKLQYYVPRGFWKQFRCDLQMILSCRFCVQMLLECNVLQNERIDY